MKFRHLAAVFLILASMTWLAAKYDGRQGAFAWTGQKSDYYDLLARGFLKGHLYLDAPVDPRLLSADPAVRRQASYLLDTSLYGGRYYLYFGVVPAALLFLPYAWLTGQDLPENAASLLLVALGFLCYLQLYRAAKRRYFPTLAAVPDACCVLLLAFGACTPILLVDGGVYEIAVAGGYLFLGLFWLCLYHAWHARSREWLWLGCGSLAGGLVVGCRPNGIVALPALAVVAILLRRPAPGTGAAGERGRRLRLAIAAILPAGAVGLGLMAYNYERFKSPFEFGFRYQLSALIDAHLPLARLSFFWPNLQWYYLRLPVLSPYFPYVFPINAADRPPGYYGYEPIQGQFPMLILALLGAAGLAALYRRRRPPPRSLAVFLSILGAAFVALFLGMAFFGFRANRYVPDFQGTLALLVALAGGLGCAGRGRRSLRFRAWRAAFCVTACAVASDNVLTGMQWLDHLQNFRPNTFGLLDRWGEYPASFLARCGLLKYGPVRFRVSFPPAAAGAGRRWWPLLATGTPTRTDVLYAIPLSPGTFEFALTYDGYGGLRSDPVPLTRGTHVIEVEMGSLYPPKIDPFFRGWPAEDVERLKTSALVLLDGRELIRGQIQSYDSPPAWVEFGRNPAGTDPPFPGSITAIERLPVPSPRTLALASEPGAWRFRIELPAQPSADRSPVLGSGISGHGNLLLLERLPGRRVAFGLDQWGAGLSTSRPLTMEPGVPHVVEVFLGPQIARMRLPAGWKFDAASLKASANLLRVWVDGSQVWTAAVVVNQDSYDFVSIGANPQGFSTAPAFFDGAIQSLPYSDDEMKTFIERNLGAPGTP